jgi:8-amino-7-oxononanoate synthase
LQAALDALEADGLRRRPRSARSPDAISFCTNDYLGLADQTVTAPSGSGASRLVDGERVEHELLESAFASFLGVEACLAFTSGYAANVGTISALAAPDDLVVSDALNHASLIDGMRLSRAKVVVVPHNDLAAVESALEKRTRTRAWVVVESYFSMDADGPDLAALRDICDRSGAALIVDEAHALGVLGPGGRGRCAEVGVRPDVVIGTLGKSFGSQGAVVGGTASLREWLWNRARSFVFSTGLSPSSAAAGREALLRSQREPALAAIVAKRANEIRNAVRQVNGLTALGFGHIIPVVIGEAERAIALSARLAKQGLDVPCIRPPTVPSGTARLRITATARQTESDVTRLVEAIRSAMAVA